MSRDGLSCPHCQLAFALTPDYLAQYGGRMTECTGCGGRFRLPAAPVAQQLPPDPGNTLAYESPADPREGSVRYLHPRWPRFTPYSLSLLPILPIVPAEAVDTSCKQEGRVAGIQIGQLLVEQGVLTDQQVRHILKVQKMSHRPFGDLAERLFGIDPHAVEDAWVQQYLRMAGVIDLDNVEIDTECLRLLNRRQAWQFHLLPLQREDDSVSVATSAEDLVRSVNFASRKLDEPVHFVIAERHQLREFLMKHYPVPEYIAQYAAKMT